MFNGTNAFAVENPTEPKDGEETNYYSIHYNGEEQELILEENNIKLILTSWSDETKSEVNAQLQVGDQTSPSSSRNELILEVTEHPIELKIMEDKSIYYTLHPSDLFHVEEINLPDSNIPTTDEVENEGESEDEDGNSTNGITDTDKNVAEEEAESIEEEKSETAPEENENSTDTESPAMDITSASEPIPYKTKIPLLAIPLTFKELVGKILFPTGKSRDLLVKLSV